MAIHVVRFRRHLAPPLIAPYFLNNLSVYDQMISLNNGNFLFWSGEFAERSGYIITNIWKYFFHSNA